MGATDPEPPSPSQPEPDTTLARAPAQDIDPERVPAPEGESVTEARDVLRTERYAAYRFQGPLPPPQILDRYNHAAPDAANRIITMAEREQAYRHEIGRGEQAIDEKIVNRGSLYDLLGLVFAFIFVMTATIGGVYLIADGQELAGFVSLLGAVGTIAGLFIRARRDRQQEQQHGVEEAQAPDRAPALPPGETPEP